jgi:hypothetical protein
LFWSSTWDIEATSTADWSRFLYFPFRKTTGGEGSPPKQTGGNGEREPSGAPPPPDLPIAPPCPSPYRRRAPGRDGDVLGLGGRLPFLIVNEPPGEELSSLRFLLIRRGGSRAPLSALRDFVCIRMADGNDPVKRVEQAEHLTSQLYAHASVPPGLVDGLPRSGSDPPRSGDCLPQAPEGSPHRGGRSPRQGNRPGKRAGLPQRRGSSSPIGTGDPDVGGKPSEPEGETLDSEGNGSPAEGNRPPFGGNRPNSRAGAAERVMRNPELDRDRAKRLPCA